MTNIVDHMGMDRIKARVPEWLRAMTVGAQLAVKCNATASRTGRRCRRTRLRGADKCHDHLHGKARDTLDNERLVRAVRKLQTTTNARHRAAAEATIRTIERRRLHRSWKLDPRLPGSTLTLSAGDEERIREWLRTHHHVDLDTAETETTGDRYMTPRCIDRLRWAGVMAVTKRIDTEGARRRVFVALRDEAKFWDKMGAAEASAEDGRGGA